MADGDAQPTDGTPAEPAAGEESQPVIEGVTDPSLKNPDEATDTTDEGAQSTEGVREQEVLSKMQLLATLRAERNVIQQSIGSIDGTDANGSSSRNPQRSELVKRLITVNAEIATLEKELQSAGAQAGGLAEKLINLLFFGTLAAQVTESIGEAVSSN